MLTPDIVLNKLRCFDDTNFKFNPTLHKYTYNGEQFESVTTLVSKFHIKFDLEGKSKKIADDSGFDQNWVKNRIAENNSKIAKLQEALENNKKRYKRAGDIKIQDRTYINYIKSLEEKNREFRQALKAYNVADILKKKIAFNSNDQEQTLLNHVRNCPELLAEIIERDSK